MKKVTWRRSLALAMSTAMILGLAGCGSEEAENTASTGSESAGDSSATETETEGDFKGTIKFGLVAPITGAHAEYGQGFDAATQIAADEINAAGGINGYRVVIEVQDSAADAKTSSDIFTRFAEDDEIGRIRSGKFITEGHRNRVFDEKSICEVIFGIYEGEVIVKQRESLQRPTA